MERSDGQAPDKSRARKRRTMLLAGAAAACLAVTAVGARTASQASASPGTARYAHAWLNPHENPDSRARELLAEERARIERALPRLAHEDDAEENDDIDPANLAADLYQDELDEGLADDLREELAALERAEARLAAGTYGLSIESGTPIPDERLEALPTAERTAEEEARRP